MSTPRPNLVVLVLLGVLGPLAAARLRDPASVSLARRTDAAIAIGIVFLLVLCDRLRRWSRDA